MLHEICEYCQDQSRYSRRLPYDSFIRNQQHFFFRISLTFFGWFQGIHIVLAADIETLCIFMKKQKQYRYFADTTRDQGSERRPELSTKESAEAGAKAWGNSEVPKKCRFFLSGFMNTIQDSQFFTPKNISGYAWNHKKHWNEGHNIRFNTHSLRALVSIGLSLYPEGKKKGIWWHSIVFSKFITHTPKLDIKLWNT